jgi:hypothetical protein
VTGGSIPAYRAMPAQGGPFPTVLVASPVAVGKRSRKGNRTHRPGFDDHDQVPAAEPRRNLCGRPRLGLEGGDAIGDALIINFRERAGITHHCRSRAQLARLSPSLSL